MQHFSENCWTIFRKIQKIANFDRIFINFLKFLKFFAEKLLSVDYIWTVLYLPCSLANPPGCRPTRHRDATLSHFRGQILKSHNLNAMQTVKCTNRQISSSDERCTVLFFSRERILRSCSATLLCGVFDDIAFRPTGKEERSSRTGTKTSWSWTSPFLRRLGLRRHSGKGSIIQVRNQTRAITHFPDNRRLPSTAYRQCFSGADESCVHSLLD